MNLVFHISEDGSEIKSETLPDTRHRKICLNRIARSSSKENLGFLPYLNRTIEETICHQSNHHN